MRHGANNVVPRSTQCWEIYVGINFCMYEIYKYKYKVFLKEYVRNGESLPLERANRVRRSRGERNSFFPVHMLLFFA